MYWQYYIFAFRQQRVLTYQVLCSWLAVAGSQSSLTMFSESLVSGILSDIKYDKPSLNLIVSLINSIKYNWSFLVALGIFFKLHWFFRLINKQVIKKEKVVL